MSPTPSYRDDAHAVVIGINEYQDLGIPDLHFARADAEGVYAVLTDPEIGRFNPELVTLLVDEQATERNIRRAIGTQLPRRAQPGHTVFVYYAGHGAPLIDPMVRSADGMEKYLIPYDAVVDDLRSSAIPMDAIQRFFEWIRATNVIFFIDTCYSGGVGGRSFDIPGFQTRAAILSEEFLDSLVANEGRYVVTACSTNEVSLETPDLGHGIFTYYLMKGLRGDADADQNGLVGVDELYDYVHRNVSRHAGSLGGRMSPIRKGSARGSVFLTQYETAKQRRAREAGVEAVAAFDRGDFGEAARLWAEVLTLEPDNQAAREGSAVILAHREEAEQLLDRRLIALRDHQKPGELSIRLFAQAVELLERAPGDLTSEERQLRQYVEHLADGEITVSQYTRAIKLLSIAVPSSVPPRKAAVTEEASGAADSPPSRSVPESGVTSDGGTDHARQPTPAGGEDISHDHQTPPRTVIPPRVIKAMMITLAVAVLYIAFFLGWPVSGKPKPSVADSVATQGDTGSAMTETPSPGTPTPSAGVKPAANNSLSVATGEGVRPKVPTKIRPVGGEVFEQAQLDEPARVLIEAEPYYPPVLAAAGVGGKVEAQFIVDTFGHAEPASYKVLNSTSPPFDEPARQAILKTVFNPARLKGKAVRQLMQQAVVFRPPSPDSVPVRPANALGSRNGLFTRVVPDRGVFVPNKRARDPGIFTPVVPSGDSAKIRHVTP